MITDNVYSATKLQTARSLWGNSFNGTSDINGSIIVSSGKYISIGNIKLEYDAANKALKITNTTTNEVANLYTSGGVSAYGVGTSSSSGGGLNGSVKSYADALKLTSESLSEVASAYSIKALDSRISSLEGGSATSISVSGSGNAVTSVTKNGTTISVVKGATFLTSHQSLSAYLKSADAANTYLTKSAASSTYQPKGNYLTSHQDISGKVNRSGDTINGVITFNNVISSNKAIDIDYNYNSSGFARDIISLRNSKYSGDECKLARIAVLCYPDSNSNGYQYIYIGSDTYEGKNLRIYKDKVTFGSNTLIDSGSIGSQSVKYATSAGNAETVDGYYATMGNNKPWGTIPVITATGGYMDIGKHLEFHYDNSTGSDYSTALMCTGNHGNVVNLPSGSGTLALITDIPTKVSSLSNDSGYITSSASITGNAATATKLQTARTIWGQSFNGTANVNGSITGVDNITMSNNSYLYGKNTGGTAIQLIAMASWNSVDIGRGALTNGYTTQVMGKTVALTASDDSGKNVKSVELSTAKLYSNVNIETEGGLLAHGGVTAYSSSDIRLKQDLRKLDYLGIIKAMGGTFGFAWKKDNTRSIGWIAQHVLCNPHLKDIVETDEKGYYKINYWSPKLIATAFGAIEQVGDEVSRLKARVVFLESEVQRLSGDKEDCNKKRLDNKNINLLN